MQHFKNISTEASRRDGRWSAARTLADCDRYMAIEAQNAARRCSQSMIDNAWKGFSFLRSVEAARAEHHHYSRTILGITEADQLYS
jgi:hypothetical protein